jgi:hypothetical protein
MDLNLRPRNPNVERFGPGQSAAARAEHRVFPANLPPQFRPQSFRAQESGSVRVARQSEQGNGNENVPPAPSISHPAQAFTWVSAAVSIRPGNLEERRQHNAGICKSSFQLKLLAR